jgi:ribosome-binding factor A
VSQRKQQRESVLLKAIQEVVSRGLADPRIRGLITITGVDLSDDGKNATVMVSVLPEDRQDLTMHGLKAAGGRIRKDAMAKVRLRDMPHLSFVTDASLKEQGELLGAINRASEASRLEDDDAPQDGVDDPATDGNDAQSGPARDAPGEEPTA